MKILHILYQLIHQTNGLTEKESIKRKRKLNYIINC